MELVTLAATRTMPIGLVVLPSLRERLALLIKQRGLSQKRLAEISGVSEPNISKILTGRVLHPTSEQITRLAAALGVSTDYLIGPERDCPPSEEDLPPDLRTRIADLPLDYRGLIDELIAAGTKLPDTPEGKAAFVQAIRVAVGFLQSVIERGE